MSNEVKGSKKVVSVELTGVKKRDIVIKALKQYLKIDTSKGMDK